MRFWNHTCSLFPSRTSHKIKTHTTFYGVQIASIPTNDNHFLHTSHFSAKPHASTMHQQYALLTTSYRRALPSAIAVSVKTTSENNAILALTRIGSVTDETLSTLLCDERFMSLLCHILNDNRHPPLLTISASPAASVQDLTQSSMDKDKNKNRDDNVTIVDTSLLPPVVHTTAVRTVTPIPILNKRKAIKRKAKDKDDHDDDDDIHLQDAGVQQMKDSKRTTKKKRFAK